MSKSYDGSDYRGSDDTIHSQTCAESHEEIVGYRLEGHRLDSRQRESTINRLLTAESKLLRCPQVEENARNMRSIFNIPSENAEKADRVAERGGIEPPGPLAFDRMNSAQIWRTIRP
jgi:hypothetical protein